MIQLFGTAGLGLVWGWLLALFSLRRPQTQPFLNFVFLSAATILATFIPLILVNVRAVVVFLIAMAIAFFIHLMWYWSMRKRVSHLS